MKLQLLWRSLTDFLFTFTGFPDFPVVIRGKLFSSPFFHFVLFLPQALEGKSELLPTGMKESRGFAVATPGSIFVHCKHFFSSPLGFIFLRGGAANYVGPTYFQSEIRGIDLARGVRKAETF